MNPSRFNVLVKLAICVALIVLVLGAYTRLTHAGLGCPDWPFCYGHLLPKGFLNSEQAPKAWTEMLHRYAAGGLLILISWISFCLFLRQYRSQIKHSSAIGLGLCLLTITQPLLGMWTVTLKLHPFIVALHLIGGFALLALLGWLNLLISHSTSDLFTRNRYLSPIHLMAAFGLCLLTLQIFLGALVSSHYASLACIGFPLCQGVTWSEIEWLTWLAIPPLGPNYELGLLQHPSRIAIHALHRMGAVLVTVYTLVLAYRVLKCYRHPMVRQAVWMVSAFLSIQWLFGIINVLYFLPLWSAMMHHGVAACLLLSFIYLMHALFNHHPTDC